MAHFLRFLVVGTIGFIINTVVLLFGVRIGFRPSLAAPIGSEIAIISNFLLNNFWAFSDRKITAPMEMASKFIQFNILSFGSVIIQFIFLKVGESIFGLKKFKEPLFSLPFFANFPILPHLPFVKHLTLYFLFYVFGVGVGLVVNFLIYNFIIWK